MLSYDNGDFRDNYTYQDEYVNVTLVETLFRFRVYGCLSVHSIVLYIGTLVYCSFAHCAKFTRVNK